MCIASHLCFKDLFLFISFSYLLVHLYCTFLLLKMLIYVHKEPHAACDVYYSSDVAFN